MVKFPGYFLGFAENAPDRVRYRYGMEAATVRAALSTASTTSPISGFRPR